LHALPKDENGVELVLIRKTSGIGTVVITVHTSAEETSGGDIQIL